MYDNDQQSPAESTTDGTKQIRSWIHNPYDLKKPHFNSIQGVVNAINEKLEEEANCPDRDQPRHTWTVIATTDGEVYEIKLRAVAVKANSEFTPWIIQGVLAQTEEYANELRRLLNKMNAQ